MSPKKTSYRMMAALLGAGALNACAPDTLSPITTGNTTSGVSAGQDQFDSGLGTASGPPCRAVTDKLVYVMTTPEGEDQHQSLYSFDPATLTFQNIGVLDCPRQPGSQAYARSMSIDHHGTAWVMFSDHTLYNASTTDGSCVATPFQSPAVLGNEDMKIGFAADAAGGTAETAYVSTSRSLLKLDPQTLQLSLVGYFVPGFNPFEGNMAPTLAGTGDGRLFTVTGGDPILAEIDKSNASPLWTMPLPAAVNKGFAAVPWGGDLWIFGNPADNNGSVVFRHDLSTQTTTMVIPETGFTVFGVGVSTCAPFTPPN